MKNQQIHDQEKNLSSGESGKLQMNRCAEKHTVQENCAV